MIMTQTCICQTCIIGLCDQIIYSDWQVEIFNHIILCHPCLAYVTMHKGKCFMNMKYVVRNIHFPINEQYFNIL